LRKGIRVDFQSDRQRHCRTYSRSHATVRRTFDGLVKFQRVSPECFVAEGIKAKRLASLLNQLLLVLRIGSLLSSSNA
jgi:hypothetical protein